MLEFNRLINENFLTKWNWISCWYKDPIVHKKVAQYIKWVFYFNVQAWCIHQFLALSNLIWFKFGPLYQKFCFNYSKFWFNQSDLSLKNWNRAIKNVNRDFKNFENNFGSKLAYSSFHWVKGDLIEFTWEVIEGSWPDEFNYRYNFISRSS